MTTKKPYAAFIVRIWSEQGKNAPLAGEWSPGAPSQLPGEQPFCAITLIDLETGARVGFSSLTRLMAYLQPFTEL